MSALCTMFLKHWSNVVVSLPLSIFDLLGFFPRDRLALREHKKGMLHVTSNDGKTDGRGPSPSLIGVYAFFFLTTTTPTIAATAMTATTIPMIRPMLDPPPDEGDPEEVASMYQ